ncbi:MAG: hypothetical protein OXE52_09815, partial [Chloroflexi bacterium]|nr:hypothetical protein [Chloroflexota bacterium]
AENFSIVMISDGGIGEIGSLPANIPQPIYLPVAQSASNVAITALATRALAGQPPQLFAQVTNYGDAPADISLVIRLDDVMRLSRSGSIPARSQLPIPFDEPIVQDFETLSATLTFDNEVEDYLDLDNRAWTVHSEVNTRRVYYVSGSGNLFLEQALRSLPGVQTFRGNPGNRSLPGERFDLYVFDNWLPNELPDADLLIVNPPNTTALFSVGSSVDSGASIEVTAVESPVTAYVDLDEMSLLSFRELRAGWAEALIRAEDGDLLLVGEVNARQVAIFSFDLRDSNLPLLIAWPVLMANLLDWFSPAEIVSLPDGLSVGDALVIQPPLFAESARVTAPDGSVQVLPVRGDALVYSDTDQLGIYLLEIVVAGEVKQRQHFAVNLFATGESDIAPVAETDLMLGGGAVQVDVEDQLGLREFWIVAAALALLLLLIEWVVYHRRLTTPTLLAPRANPRFQLPFLRSS